tara:strand:- start:208 stop:1065 length:858 start_codon:yes stop_codon:yes gene_type:complete
MIKKIILKKATRAIINRGKLRKFVARGGKIKQLPAQKSAPVFKNVEAQAAQTKFVKTFGENPGFGSGRGLRIEEASELGAKELAASTARAKWNKQITKFVTRKRSTIASRVKTFRNQNIASGQKLKQHVMVVNPAALKTRKASPSLIKKSIKSAKIREYNKALGAADTKAKSVYQKTLTMFTGKSGADPLKHKLVDTKFITTKKYRKGKPKGVSERDLLWAPRGPHGESFSKLSGAAYHEKGRMIKFANMPGNKTSDGQVKWKKFWKQEQQRKREWAQSFPKKKK